MRESLRYLYSWGWGKDVGEEETPIRCKWEWSWRKYIETSIEVPINTRNKTAT